MPPMTDGGALGYEHGEFTTTCQLDDGPTRLGSQVTGRGLPGPRPGRPRPRATRS